MVCFENRYVGYEIFLLLGIASFQDRYLLTMDSKASADETAENSRLLLFDSSNGQLVFEQHIGINRASEVILKQQSLSHIQGKILSETTSKPRFLAVHNDDVYVADLGKNIKRNNIKKFIRE